MKSSLMALAVVSALVVIQASSAAVLWDQSDFDPWGPGFFNSESGGPPFGMTQHSVNDISVGGTGWQIESITTYYSALDLTWGDGITQGYLHIFDKTAPLPVDGVDDPTASPVVSMSALLNVDHWIVTAADLNVDLAPGEYWIGITPIAPSGPFGPEIHMASLTLTGDATASYDVYAFPGPPTWYNLNPGVDASILIEGTAPTPIDDATWGAIKALYR